MRRRTTNGEGPRVRARGPWVPGLWLVLVALLAGCATGPRPRGERPFVFAHDTFGFANELVWEYGFDTAGRWRSRRREPAPDYTHHCFVVARAARQFFAHAEFDPLASPVDEGEYRRLVREVMRRSPRRESAPGGRVVIPAFAHLREFSRSHEAMLKAECGGAAESYLQRGHWRMVFPFGRGHQADVAAELAAAVRAWRAPVVHVVRFPQLTINHALVVFGVAESAGALTFQVYDPNRPAAPVALTFDRATRTFALPQNDYFAGGRVDVYEVYHRWNY